MIRILMTGDTVARSGRRALEERLHDLRSQREIDFVVSNVENAAGGFSITSRIAEDMLAAGVDVMTSGNHIFDKKEILEYIDKQPRLLRPANYSPGVPGKGRWVGKVRGVPVAVINLQGRVFMSQCDDPFRCADTHTHVQTADEQILPEGTAYITDLGMVGPHDGVIGMQTEIVLERFLRGLSTKFEPCDGEIKLNGLMVDVDEETGKATRVERLSLPHS